MAAASAVIRYQDHPDHIEPEGSPTATPEPCRESLWEQLQPWSALEYILLSTRQLSHRNTGTLQGASVGAASAAIQFPSTTEPVGQENPPSKASCPTTSRATGIWLTMGQKKARI